MKSIRYTLFAAITSIGLVGCATGPVQFGGHDDCGPEPGSDMWWAEKALLPPGARQVCHKGKMWPVRPRPNMEKQQFSHAFHSAHYWPLPYVCQDRAYVNNILDIQAQNGWEQESTLFGRYFDEEQQLTEPGRMALENIVLVNPMQYRTVYLQSSYDVNIDNVRTENTRTEVARILGNPDEVSVVVRRARDYSRPARQIQLLNDAFDSSMPAPRLASAGGGGGAAAGGGGDLATGP